MWRTCWNPGASTGESDPAGGNSSHHAPLRSPTAKPRVRAEYTPELRREPDKWNDTCQGARGVKRWSSWRPSRQKIRLRRGVKDGRWYGFTERTRGTKLQFPWFGLVLITKVLDRGRVVVRRKRYKPLTVVHVDRLEAYRGTVMPAWMTAEQRGCVAV